MSSFTKGHLSAAFAATGIGFDQEPASAVASDLKLSEGVQMSKHSHLDEQALKDIQSHKIKTDQQRDHELAVSEQLEAAGRIQNVSASMVESSKERQKKDKARRARHDTQTIMLMLNNLNSTVLGLEGFGVEIDELINELQVERDEKQSQLNELNALNQTKALIEGGGQAAIGTDGKLQNVDLERMIQRHEKKTGHAVDRENPALLLAILEQQRADYADPKMLEKHIEEIDQDLEKLGVVKTENNALITEGNDLKEEGSKFNENTPPEKIADYKVKYDAYEKNAEERLDSSNKRLDIIEANKDARERSVSVNKDTLENTTSSSSNYQATAGMTFSMD